MPAISRFFGIVIDMYFKDQPPPHFHARYGEYEAFIAIRGPEVVRGWLPKRAGDMVLEWAAAHREELTVNWGRASEGLPLNPIPPLE